MPSDDSAAVYASPNFFTAKTAKVFLRLRKNSRKQLNQQRETVDRKPISDPAFFPYIATRTDWKPATCKIKDMEEHAEAH